MTQWLWPMTQWLCSLLLALASAPRFGWSLFASFWPSFGRTRAGTLILEVISLIMREDAENPRRRRCPMGSRPDHAVGQEVALSTNLSSTLSPSYLVIILEDVALFHRGRSLEVVRLSTSLVETEDDPLSSNLSPAKE
jgi:hypothetical protein